MILSSGNQLCPRPANHSHAEAECGSAASVRHLVPWSRRAEGAEAGNRVRMAVGTKAPSTSLSDHVQQGSF